MLAKCCGIIENKWLNFEWSINSPPDDLGLNSKFSKVHGLMCWNSLNIDFNTAIIDEY